MVEVASLSGADIVHKVLTTNKEGGPQHNFKPSATQFGTTGCYNRTVTRKGGWTNKANVKLLEWPSQSPDLNLPKIKICGMCLKDECQEINK